MDMPGKHLPAPVQVVRDRHGVVIGRYEERRLVDKTVARNSGGIVVGSYDHRANTTRDARGVIVGIGNLLAALLMAPL